jgi:importin-4
MTPLMSEVWPIIESGLQDGDAGVRKATCIAVSCLCEWLEDECSSKHAVLVPVSQMYTLPHFLDPDIVLRVS